jgi:hypothetical protein
MYFLGKEALVKKEETDVAIRDLDWSSSWNWSSRWYSSSCYDNWYAIEKKSHHDDSLFICYAFVQQEFLSGLGEKSTTR